jgi:hypothetical protein
MKVAIEAATRTVIGVSSVYSSELTIPAINPLFPTPQKSEDFIFICSPGYVISNRNPQPKISSLSDDL